LDDRVVDVGNCANAGEVEAVLAEPFDDLVRERLAYVQLSE